jgi:hypothetical protein
LFIGVDQKIERLEDFEKNKFLEMHQIILDDDGIPDLMKKIREIKFSIDDIYNIKYEGPKIANASRDKIV